MPGRADDPPDHKLPKPIKINKDLLNHIIRTGAFPPNGASRIVHWDHLLKGFGIRVNPNGSIVYIVQYRMKAKNAKTQTFTIGKHGSPWTPDAARHEARMFLEQVYQGIDPVAQRRAAAHAREEEAREEDKYDFDAFADRYIQRHVRANGLRSLSDIEGTFTRDLRPFFKGRSVREITKQDCKDMRAKVGDRSRHAANKAHKWLNAAFMWGIEHDGLDTSPMFGLKKPFKEDKRTRVLAEWEIAIIWSVLPMMAWQFAMLNRLSVRTSQPLSSVTIAHA